MLSITNEMERSFQQTSRYDHSRIITTSCRSPFCFPMREIPDFGLEPLSYVNVPAVGQGDLIHYTLFFLPLSLRTRNPLRYFPLITAFLQIAIVKTKAFTSQKNSSCEWILHFIECSHRNCQFLNGTLSFQQGMYASTS